MGVTNLENNQNHAHVKHIAEFAIDIVNEASKVMIDLEDSSRGFVSLRVGFHSGSVVSNVIGTLNKRYCSAYHFGCFGTPVQNESLTFLMLCFLPMQILSVW